MADPKIKVGADMSAVESAMGKLNIAAKKVVDTLTGSSVGLDVKEAMRDLAELKEAAKGVADELGSIKGFGNISSSQLSQITNLLGSAAEHGEALEKVVAAVGQSTGYGQSIRASEKIATNFERAVKAQKILRDTGIKVSDIKAQEAVEKFEQLRSSGARGTRKFRDMDLADFLGGGYRNHSIDPAENERVRRKLLDSIGIDAGGGAAGEAKTSYRSRFGNAAMGALGGIGMAALNGGDGMFGALGSAGGVAAGGFAGMFTGGPVAAAIGAAAGKVLGSIGNVVDQSLARITADAVNLTDLRHSIGKTSTDFTALRDTTRELAQNLRLTNAESSMLARTFADAAGQTQSVTAVAKGMQLGGGFARSFGMDPTATAMFFGSMQRMGATSDDRSNRRLALLIGEAVVSRGITPQMSAVLRAVQSYTESTTRLSFTRANATGYTDFMASMLGTGLAGSKDVGAITSAMGAADAAMRQGGAFGLGSKTFGLGIFQRMLPGFNAFDLDPIYDQGAFGTLANAFGKGSAAYQFALSNHDPATAAKYARWANSKDANTPLLDIRMRALKKMYGGNTDMLRKVLQTDYGLTAGQAEQLFIASQHPGGLGGLQKQLAAAGVDVASINPKQIGDLAAVAGMNRDGIRAQAQKLLGDKSLTIDDKERKALQKGTLEEQRKAVLKITALNDTEKDQGEQLDQLNKTFQNLLDNTVTKLVPLTMDIRRGIIAMAEKIAPGFDKTPVAPDGNGNQPGTITRGPGFSLHYRPGSPGSIALKGQQAKNRDMVIARLAKTDANDDEKAAILGLILKESSFVGNTSPDAGAHAGLGQLSVDYARHLGITNRGDAAQNADKVPPEMLRVLRKYEHNTNGGHKYFSALQLFASEWLGGSHANYVGKDGQWHIHGRKDILGTDTAHYGDDLRGYTQAFRSSGLLHKSSFDRQHVDVQHTVVVVDPQGRRLGTSHVNTYVGAPVPAGASIA